VKSIFTLIFSAAKRPSRSATQIGRLNPPAKLIMRILWQVRVPLREWFCFGGLLGVADCAAHGEGKSEDSDGAKLGK